MQLLPRIRFLFVLFFSAFPAAFACAHPHVWVTMETEVELSANKEILGFRHKWTFDEGYTTFALEGLDTKGDGVYSEEVLKPLAQTNIEALKEFEYFTFPFIGDKKIAVKEPVDYHLEYKDKLLTLYFTVPLETPVPSTSFKDFSLAIYDPEMYVAMTFDDKAPVRIVSPKPLPCAAHVGDRTAAAKNASSARLGEITPPSSNNIFLQFAERVTVTCDP